MTDAEIELSGDVADADAAFLRRGLLEHNQLFLGESDYRQFVLMARADGEPVGGLLAETGRGALYIDMLWLAPGHRRQGLGSRLLLAAEAEARRRGCRMAWLDTYDFQARAFYERHGYAVFGELDGLANGHRRHFMKKRLDRPSAGGDP
ncbi:MAG: GNAT family N-acetyltransferase [Geminicoccaceae bacterium]